MPVIILATVVMPPPCICSHCALPAPQHLSSHSVRAAGSGAARTRRDLLVGLVCRPSSFLQPWPLVPCPPPLPRHLTQSLQGFVVLFCRHFEFMSGDQPHPQGKNHWYFELGGNCPFISPGHSPSAPTPGVSAAGHCRARTPGPGIPLE